MVLDPKHVLTILGWSEGVPIPAANEDNRKLEAQLAEMFKRKSEAMVNLCVMKENARFVKKSLNTLNKQRDYNQEFLNGLSNQFNIEMNAVKEAEVEKNTIGNDMKSLRKGIKEMEKSIQTHKANIDDYTRKMLQLKDSLCWGDDALFNWEQTVQQGEAELKTLEKYKNLNEGKFQALERDKDKAEAELFEAVELGRREDERFKIISLQLENLSKLIREASKDHESLMKVWQESLRTAANREEENKQLLSILSEVMNNCRQKCSELYEEEKLYEYLKSTSESLSSDIDRYREDFRRTKEDITNLENDVKQIQSEVDAKKKIAGNMGGQLEIQRMKNSELKAKLKARKKQIEQLQDIVTHLKEECNALKMDNQTIEDAFNKADEIYEMKMKEMEERKKEFDRLNLLSSELQIQINKIKEKINCKHKEHVLAEKLIKSYETDLTKKREDMQALEHTLFFLAEEELMLTKKILELRDKCSGRQEREELERELKQLEEQEDAVTKEHLQLKKRMECLQKECRDRLRDLRSAEEELEKLTVRHISREIEYQQSKKDLESVQEEQNKSNARLKLFKMRENCLRESIIREDNTVGALERKRTLLEMAMRNRVIEVEAQKDVLQAKRRSLEEEKHMRSKQIDHINAQIKLYQTKYGSTLDLMGKDDSGERYSVSYYKIKLAQEKYELQIECEELEAKIAKAECEISAMEKTLMWVKVSNENFKFAVETVDENDKVKIEKEKAESKLLDYKNILERETAHLKSLEPEMQEMLKEIFCLKDKNEGLAYDKKIKECEFEAQQKGLILKCQSLQRATVQLKKILRTIKWMKEPPKYKELALREINWKMEVDRQNSAFKQLADLSTHSENIKTFIEKYSAYFKLPPPRPQVVKSVRSSFSLTRLGTASSRGSSSSSTSTSGISIIDLTPAKLFPDMKPCKPSKGKSQTKF